MRWVLWTQVRGESCLDSTRLYWPGAGSLPRQTPWHQVENAVPICGSIISWPDAPAGWAWSPLSGVAGGVRLLHLQILPSPTPSLQRQCPRWGEGAVSPGQVGAKQGWRRRRWPRGPGLVFQPHRPASQCPWSSSLLSGTETVQPALPTCSPEISGPGICFINGHVPCRWKLGCGFFSKWQRTQQPVHPDLKPLYFRPWKEIWETSLMDGETAAVGPPRARPPRPHLRHRGSSLPRCVCPCAVCVRVDTGNQFPPLAAPATWSHQAYSRGGSGWPWSRAAAPLEAGRVVGWPAAWKWESRVSGCSAQRAHSPHLHHRENALHGRYENQRVSLWKLLSTVKRGGCQESCGSFYAMSNMLETWILGTCIRAESERYLVASRVAPFQ